MYFFLAQRTDLKRRQAIKVKRSPSSRSLNTSITTRIRRKAREAKEDVQGDGHTHQEIKGEGENIDSENLKRKFENAYERNEAVLKKKGSRNLKKMKGYHVYTNKMQDLIKFMF